MKRETDNALYCLAMTMATLLPPSGEMPDDERQKLRNERKRTRRARR